MLLGNMCMHTSSNTQFQFWDIYLGAIGGSCGDSIFNFLRKHQLFSLVAALCTFPAAMYKVQFSYLCHHLLFSCLRMIAILGVPSWSSSWDSMISPRAQVQSSVKELDPKSCRVWPKQK